nr:hypothetical protein [Tanacetum cinerariifolium]
WLQRLEKEKTTLGLIVKDDPPAKDKTRQFETSLVDPSRIVGRQGDKDAFVLKLLRNEPRNNGNFSIVPIVGLGGVGKTTLAKILYDDEKVKKRFRLKAWVCVSDEWDTFVLDDVRSDWESLVAPLSACALGSKIIITTRKEKLLRELGCGKVDHLQSLSHADAVCLFARHALGANNFDSHTRLEAHGEDIVTKCNGLPLALKALGRLLRGKEEEVEWKELEESKIWELKEEAYKKFEGIEGTKGLRTFLFIGVGVKEWWHSNYLSSKVVVDLLPQLHFLRVLSSSGYVMSEVPESIAYKKFEGIEGTKGLRTFLFIGVGVKEWWHSNYLSSKVVVDLLPQLHFLRVLSSSGYVMSEVPESIDAFRNDTTENVVLDALNPYNDCLEKLGIVKYMGLEFPKWVGDSSFRQLACVSIRGCKKCTSLQPLRQLQSLKELSIQDMGDVKVVGSEFFGTGLAFPSLESLSFRNMSGWKEWSTNNKSVVGDSVFPCLKELKIERCPYLVEVSLKAHLRMRPTRVSFQTS